MSRSRLLLHGSIMGSGGVMLAACGVILVVTPSSAPAPAAAVMLVAGALGVALGVWLLRAGFRTPR